MKSSCCATLMAATDIVNMKKTMKSTTKTRTEFNLFDGKNTEHYLCNKAIKVLSDNVERRSQVQEDSLNKGKYKK
jgi:hypothetical protein